MSEPRERLTAAIARRDAERGRPLTAMEKLRNLAAALAEDADTPCPLCGVLDHQPCPAEVAGSLCRLERPVGQRSPTEGNKPCR